MNIIIPYPPATTNTALDYAARGWRVLPVYGIADGACTCRLGKHCGSAGKHPRTRHGVNDATAETQQIEEWWQRWPGANIALACGAASGLVVLDIDTRNDGETTMVALSKKLGELPNAPTVRTGGGVHLYFRHPAGDGKARAKLGAGVDVQAGGRYVVAPPSGHVSGVQYEWLTPPDGRDLPQLPALWLEGLRGSIDPPNQHQNTTHTTHTTHTQCVRGAWPKEGYAAFLPTRHGERHECLLQLIRALARHPDYAGLPAAAIRPVVQEWHRAALPNIRTKSFLATWREAVDAWRSVDTKRGGLRRVLDAAMRHPAPACCARLGYLDDLPTVRLVKVCRELQRHAGDRPFFLSCRLAAEVMGVGRELANQTLHMLQADGALELVQRGDKTSRRASEYRYLGGD